RPTDRTTPVSVSAPSQVLFRLGRVARDAKRQRVVDVAIRIGEIDLDVVDGRGQRHVLSVGVVPNPRGADGSDAVLWLRLCDSDSGTSAARTAPSWLPNCRIRILWRTERLESISQRGDQAPNGLEHEALHENRSLSHRTTH